MRASTEALHEKVVALGKRLGFVAEREVVNPLLGLGSDQGGDYQPRLDILWSLPLGPAQRSALGGVLGIRPASLPTHLPICGWEIEGTAPSTKTLEADFANLLAAGAPIGCVLVNDSNNGGGEPGIYGRAVRAARTLRYQFGDRTLCPLDASWIEDDFVSTPFPDARQSMARSKTPTGGETRKWAAGLRDKLRALGASAGFEVAESWSDPHYEQVFQRIQGLAKDLVDRDPQSGEPKKITQAKQYFTRSVIDLVWILRLPAAFRAFANAIAARNPALVEHGILNVGRFDQLVVLAVELETSKGKHAAGGLLNLASHGMFGLMATEHTEAEEMVRRALRTYQRARGLQHVFVRKL
jgi:hypothetical protein